MSALNFHTPRVAPEKQVAFTVLPGVLTQSGESVKEMTMGKTKSIPSIYKGVTFRSRLEARWAAVFDHYEVPWAYEPDAYDTPSGFYLPDFYLPTLHTFVEVKPGPNQFDEVALRSVIDQTGAQFLVLDSPVVMCRAYPVLCVGLSDFQADKDKDLGDFDTDMSWCMSSKYLGRNPHDGAHRFYLSVGSSDAGHLSSGTCVSCGLNEYAAFREDPHFIAIRSMRFERGYAQ